MEKICGMEVALTQLTTEQLLDVVEQVAECNYDGHYSVLSFTTGYKVSFYTPDLRSGFGWITVDKLQSFDTLRGALINAIMYEPNFCSDEESDFKDFVENARNRIKKNGQVD